MPLIRTFAPLPDESPLGYYRRLASANALSGWQELARLCEVAITKGALFARPEYVAASLVLDPAWAIDATGKDDVARGWRGLRRSRADAMCPHCLRESAHIRATWEHAYVVACPTHEVVLCESCDACGARLRASREHIAFCDCGHDLRQNATTPATSAQLWLAQLLQSNGASSGHWMPLVADVHPDLVSSLVRTLCLMADPHTQPRRNNTVPPKTVLESVEFLRPLERLLADWPRGFEAHVSERIAAAPSDARTLNSLLGQWYEQLRAFHECVPLQPFLHAVGRVAVREFDGLIGLDSAAQLTTKEAPDVMLSDAAERLGITRPALTTALSKGQVVHRKRRFGTRGHAYVVPVSELEAIARARAAWLSEDDACRRLDVPAALLARLCDAELLRRDPQWRQDVRKAGPIELASVLQLAQQLAAHAPVQAPAEQRRMKLRDLNSRRVGDRTALLAALRAIAEGDIRPVAGSDCAGGYEYLASDVARHISRPVVEAGLSVQALAQASGWKWESIGHWIDLGLLESTEVVLRGQPCRVVMPTQLLQFCRTYVPLADLARQLGSKSSALMERLSGIEVFGALELPNGQRRGGLVRAADLAAAALRKPARAQTIKEVSHAE